MPPRTSRAATAEIISVAPPFDDDELDEQEDDSKTMEETLLANGARRNGQGNWYRRVPDPKVAKRRVVENGRVYMETSWIRRPVAVAPTWDQALEIAKASLGQMDALIPGVGWVRGGTKIEVEHPSNVGVLTTIETRRVTREEVEPDVAAAEQAIALRPTLEAVASGGASRAQGAPAQGD
jgi:hypothetical protein